ncbi:tetraacyldisaccharide 4'-kinase [Leptospira meyeri]|uniref:tetraacyldisaccharide 4'-kinase n=1 Tax=Leptospira meyeri TaxID=29508 RepID=UPI000C2A4B03|nr:tetraacyldisaccharide 4'-kinase [Leptospira meyeri]PJZ82094.1 tetraacyldisaccharide 4'-kinase [Leptospira meyeri]PJZ97599.1 tetraacyldisaccharide 4'-kinase [Leptospira meyeri]PKA10951.1 tetraacyldisaccharide 4'-kinase [Leptospira meyeri]PKA27556.1 tetraacyldisaccharide 4'-kinase [Leptospira sp. mixed culture ATI2-C-A1]
MKIFLYLLYPFSLLYRFLFWWQQKGIKSFHLPNALVVSVGNITVGGTGKTPFVQYLVHFFKETYPGYAISILSRGYKAEKSRDGAILPNESDPKLYGDEPSQHKEVFPDVQVIIGRNRKKAFLNYNKFQSSKHIVILDDGFQHKALHRDFDFVLLDSNSPFGNGFTIPLGFLREPIHHLKRADAIVFTKLTSNNQQKLEKYTNLLNHAGINTPVFHSTFKASIREVIFDQSFSKKSYEPNSDGKYFLVTGVGNPNHVYSTAKLTLDSVRIRKKFYPDHFEFHSDSLESLVDEIEAGEILVTTEKDWVKMRSNLPFVQTLEKKKIRLLLILIQVSVNEDQKIKSMLAALVSTYEAKIDQVSKI